MHKKSRVNIRAFKFFYIIGWIIKYCVTHWTNFAVLSRMNSGIPNGGKSTLPKSYTYEYFTNKNPVAKKHFVEYVKIPRMSANKTKHLITTLLKQAGNNKMVFKPDRGIRSIGVVATNNGDEIETLLNAAKTDYIAQRYIDYTYELGVFYYKYPTWKKGKIMGIAERTFDEIADPSKKEQYTNRDELITPQLLNEFNKIVSDREVCFCRFDVRAKSLEDFKRGKNFWILEANAGPDAVALHALDKNYPWKKQLRLYSESYRHAFNIAELNKNKPRTGLIKYFYYMISDVMPLFFLRLRVRKIIDRYKKRINSITSYK